MNSNSELITLQQQINQLNQRLDQLQTIIQPLATLPETIKQTISDTFQQYLIFPDDITIHEKQRATPHKKDVKSTQKQTQQQTASTTSPMNVKENQISKDVVETKLKTSVQIPVFNSGKVKKETPKQQKVVERNSFQFIRKLTDKQMTFNCVNKTLIGYEREKGLLSLGDDIKVLDSFDAIVDDIEVTKDGDILVATKTFIRRIHNGKAEQIDRSATSCCEFGNELVSVSQNGLTGNAEGKEIIINSYKQRYLFKNPKKVRSSPNILFVLDCEGEVLALFDAKFKYSRGIKCRNFFDFCVVSDEEIVILTARQLRLVSIKQELMIKKVIDTRFNGKQLDLIRIEYVKDTINNNDVILCMSGDGESIYQVSMDEFK
ncbi:Uncharacterized protein QTN25_002370 [Entamoeba marina]